MESAAPDAVTLTQLYVPGSQPARFTKALGSGADGVVFDLEDAVAPAAKVVAREEVVGFLSDYQGGVATQIRVNSVDSPWFDEDRAAIEGLPHGVAVRVPKVETVEEVEHLASVFPGRELHLLVETARGVQNLGVIAQMPQVGSVGLGEADLRSSMLLSGDVTLDWIRAQLVVASQAAGLGAPMMSVYPQVRDFDGLRASTQRGAAMGFVGRMVIHPGQIPAVREAFRPSREAVETARVVVARVATAVANNQGTVVLEDGTFLDVAMVARAKFTLALDRACRS